MGTAFAALAWASAVAGHDGPRYAPVRRGGALAGPVRRDLPAERFGPWHTVYARFRRWGLAGVWPRVLAQVQNATGLHRLMVDSTAVRAHQVAARAKKKTAPWARRSAAAAAVSLPNFIWVATRRAGFAPWP
ncbi:transposase [Hymenobacter glacialis]|uniref:transposase n=1 Tax=Hymenobacter glacialis TaxID=1908236 RepID=UPI000B8EDC6F